MLYYVKVTRKYENFDLKISCQFSIKILKSLVVKWLSQNDLREDFYIIKPSFECTGLFIPNLKMQLHVTILY